MIYADYRFYKRNGSGVIPRDEYKWFALQASGQMDYLTFSRITPENVTERIQLCQCELADYLYQQHTNNRRDENHPAPVKATTVDKYRVEYAVSETGKASGEINRSVVNICQKWLTRPTNLMYAGVEL